MTHRYYTAGCSGPKTVEYLRPEKQVSGGGIQLSRLNDNKDLASADNMREFGQRPWQKYCKYMIEIHKR